MPDSLPAWRCSGSFRHRRRSNPASDPARTRPVFSGLILVLLTGNLITAGGVSFAAGRPPQSPEALSLHLVDGSYLPGRILDSSDGTRLTWRSPFFTTPFEFPLEGVSTVHYPVKAPAPEPSGEYCVELSSGDVLYGDLLGLSEAAVYLRTQRAGDIHISRQYVQRIYRWQETGLIYLGPKGLDGWKVESDSAEATGRWQSEGGWPVTDKAGAVLFQDFDLPPRVSIEFKLSWKSRPDFQFAFGVDESVDGNLDFFRLLHFFRLEVWGDDIVLVAETPRDADVARVTPIADGPGAVRGVVYLDQEKQRLTLYSRSGRQKAAVRMHSKKPVTREGLRLRNRKGHIRLNHLRIAHWDGVLPRDVQADRSRIHRTDGTIAYGEVTGFDPESSVFTMRDGEEQTIRLPADNISDIFLSPGPSDEQAVDASSSSDSSGDDPDQEASRDDSASGDRTAGDASSADEGSSADKGASADEGAFDDAAAEGGTDESAPADDRSVERNRPAAEDVASAPPVLQVAYQDGSRFSGRLRGIRNRTILLSSPRIQEPLSLPMHGLRSLSPATEQTLAARARGSSRGEPAGRSGRLELDFGGVRLQGRLVDGTESESGSCLVWHPHLSRNASPLSKDPSGRIVYREKSRPNKERSAAAEEKAARAAQIRQQQRPAGGVFGGLLQLIVGGQSGQPKAEPAQQPAQQQELRTLHLRSGDNVPCEVTGIDKGGLHFTTPLSDATFVRHEEIKVVELSGKKGNPELDETKRERLLTLPRIRKGSPPTHLIYSKNGDFLRGRILTMDADHLNVEVRLETQRIPRDRVAQIIWLHPDELNSDDQTSDTGSEDKEAESGTDEEQSDEADSEKTDAANDNESDDNEAAEPGDDGEASPAVSEEPGTRRSGTRVQTVRNQRDRLTFQATSLKSGTLSGRSHILGNCRADLSEADRLLFGSYIEQAAARLAYHRWKLHHATEPRFVDSAGNTSPMATGTQSPLVGQPAPDFTLPRLGGESFRLSDHRGEIIVLDFWATWCGPCLQTMPLVEEIVGEFKEHDVRLLAVNMEEQAAQIESMLERHGFSMPVLLDRDGAAALKYEVTSIPQTVVINRGGTVSRLFVGGGPKLAEPLRKALQELVAKEPGGPNERRSKEEQSDETTATQ